MRRRLLAAMVAATLAALLIPLVAGPAAAHEEKAVGKYHVVAGFGDEPAYAGEKNSVQLILAGADDKPVTDLGNTLKVEVTTGSAEPLELAMKPFFEAGEFGTPGDYRAFFIPTAPGTYSFHFTGTIKGQKIHQTFKSGPCAGGPRPRLPEVPLPLPRTQEYDKTPHGKPPTTPRSWPGRFLPYPRWV